MFETGKLDLSDAVIQGFAAPKAGERRFFDVRLTGFLVRIWPSGRKVFGVRFRRGRRTELHTIGKFLDPWTTEHARTRASEILQSIPGGHSRAQDRRADRTMTVKALCDRYLSEGPLTNVGKRASSWKTDVTNLRRHVQPLLGNRLVNELTRTDIAQTVRQITDGFTAGDIRTKSRGVARVRGGPGSAARVKGTLSAMFNWAINQELLEENPTTGVKVARTKMRERFLSDAEVKNLLHVLTENSRNGSINRQHANVIRLLLFTGARKSEIIGLRWSEVDLVRDRLTIPAERTKSGRHNGVRYIPLGSIARDILGGISRTNEFVFPADRQARSGHMTGIQKSWKRIRELCSLEDMRLHDLRHSFASFAIANGESIYLISAVLGHATTRMTERYLHLRDDDVRALAERTSQRIIDGSRSSRVASQR